MLLMGGSSAAWAECNRPSPVSTRTAVRILYSEKSNDLRMTDISKTNIRHMLLNMLLCCKVEWGPLGDKCMHASAIHATNFENESHKCGNMWEMNMKGPGL